MQFRRRAINRTNSEASKLMRLLSNTDHEPTLNSIIIETLLKFKGLKNLQDVSEVYTCTAKTQLHMMDRATLLMRDWLLVKLQDQIELTDVETIALALIMSLYNVTHNAEV